MLRVVAAVAAVLVAACFLACAKNPSAGSASGPPQPTPGRPNLVVSWIPKQFVDEYRENEVKADGRLKGEWVQVEGKINRIGNDAGGAFVLMEPPYQLDPASVQCNFRDRADVANLAAGQVVRINGKCVGKRVHIQLQDCHLVK